MDRPVEQKLERLADQFIYQGLSKEEFIQRVLRLVPAKKKQDAKEDK